MAGVQLVDGVFELLAARGDDLFLLVVCSTLSFSDCFVCVVGTLDFDLFFACFAFSDLAISDNVFDFPSNFSFEISTSNWEGSGLTKSINSGAFDCTLVADSSRAGAETLTTELCAEILVISSGTLASASCGPLTDSVSDASASIEDSTVR